MYDVIFKMEDNHVGTSTHFDSLEDALRYAKGISTETDYYVYIYNKNKLEYFCKNGETEKNNS